MYIDGLTIDEVLEEMQNYKEWEEKVYYPLYYKLQELYSINQENYSNLKKVQEDIRNGIDIVIPPELQWRCSDLVDGRVKEMAVIFDGKKYQYVLFYYRRCDDYSYEYTAYPTHKIPLKILEYLEKEGILESAKNFYIERKRVEEQLKENISKTKEQIENLKKQEKDLKYKFKSIAIETLWELRTDPIFPEDAYFRVENFLKILRQLKEVE